jgi:hypothetical protein
LCCCLSIWFFTNHSPFKNNGTIGDTIGGLTAPVFNLIASILIFISFKEQYKANQIQKEALKEERDRTNSINEFQHIDNLITEIKNEINSLRFSYNKGNISGNVYYKGIESLKNLDNAIPPTNHFQQEYFENLNISINLLLFTIDKINEFKYNKNEGKVLRIKLYNFIYKFSNELIEFINSLNKMRN